MGSSTCILIWFSSDVILDALVSDWACLKKKTGEYRIELRWRMNLNDCWCWSIQIFRREASSLYLSRSPLWCWTGLQCCSADPTFGCARRQYAIKRAKCILPSWNSKPCPGNFSSYQRSRRASVWSSVPSCAMVRPDRIFHGLDIFQVELGRGVAEPEKAAYSLLTDSGGRSQSWVSVSIWTPPKTDNRRNWLYRTRLIFRIRWICG